MFASGVSFHASGCCAVGRCSGDVLAVGCGDFKGTSACFKLQCGDFC